MPVELEGGSGRAVLIVEDSENSAAMLEMAFLGIPGVSVMQAASGVEALRILNAAATPVTAVVTDLNMPRMDGFELIRRIRGARRRCVLPETIFTGAGAPHTGATYQWHQALVCFPWPRWRGPSSYPPKPTP